MSQEAKQSWLDLPWFYSVLWKWMSNTLHCGSTVCSVVCLFWCIFAEHCFCIHTNKLRSQCLWSVCEVSITRCAPSGPTVKVCMRGQMDCVGLECQSLVHLSSKHPPKLKQNQRVVLNPLHPAQPIKVKPHLHMNPAQLSSTVSFHSSDPLLDSF